MLVKIEAEKKYLPQYETAGAAAMDLKARTDSTLTLFPRERALIPTGVSIALPQGYAAEIQPRSGLALSKGLSIVNAPGLIDSDYRGEIGVILLNTGHVPIEINDGDRIAQMKIIKVERVQWELGELDNTERGAGGFGHTG